MRHEAPEYCQENLFIFTGYRINFNSPRKVIKSLFLWHNELFNIWSHLAGCIMVMLVILFLAAKIMPMHQLSYFISSDSINATHYANSSQIDRFSALLDQLPDLDHLENSYSQKNDETINEFQQFKASYVSELNTKVEKAIADVETFANSSLTAAEPSKIAAFLNSIEKEVNLIVEKYTELKSKLDASLKELIEKAQKNQASLLLKAKLIEVEKSISKVFYEKLDSADYDWIDVYKYIDHRDHSVPPLQSVHRWPIFVFLLSAAFCLGGSSIFHLACCMSHKVSSVLNRLDFAGISILITGSCFPPMVYGFYCQPFYAILYLSILSIVSLFVFFVMIGNTIHQEKYRHYKGWIWAGNGIFGAFPAIHLVYNELHIVPGSDDLPLLSSVPYYLAMGACYLVGVFIYTTRMPEKFIPGKVDNCGHSHNIWHVFVLLAIVMHYFASFENYYTRMETVCKV